MQKVIGTAYRFVTLNDDGVLESFVEGMTVQIKKRNYEVAGGYELIEGVLDSIMPTTNELRIDCSKTNDSKYVVVNYGQILDIVKVDTGEVEEKDDLTVIKELLLDLKTKVDEIYASCMSCRAQRQADETPEGTDPTSSTDDSESESSDTTTG